MFFCLLDKAKILADKVGGEAITLAELANFKPEDGMVLANTTSVGMKPRTDQTPIPKVCLLSHSLVLCAVVNLMKDQISGNL